MKKTLKVAMAASVLATPAMATANLENPLYMPMAGQVYSKTGVGVMYKKADNSDAHVTKGHDGASEFPIWRLSEDIGVGITDRLMVHGSFGYTHDGDIDRQGMHLGRFGLTWRSFQSHEDFIWDWYGDIHLGGISKMKGAYKLYGPNPLVDGSFQYDNYSNGRWGFHVGTKLGKTWGGFTGAVFAEIQQTFGNDNNKIDISEFTAGVKQIPGMGILDLPDTISVNLKSTTEFNAGVRAFWQLDDRWSLGTGFTYKHHVDNGVKSLATDVDMTNGVNKMIVTQLLGKLADMNDGFDEYIISAAIANQLTDTVQVALYGEYTFDTAHALSQNGTDIKAEVGVRVNLRF